MVHMYANNILDIFFFVIVVHHPYYSHIYIQRTLILIFKLFKNLNMLLKTYTTLFQHFLCNKTTDMCLLQNISVYIRINSTHNPIHKTKHGENHPPFYYYVSITYIQFILSFPLSLSLSSLL